MFKVGQLTGEKVVLPKAAKQPTVVNRLFADGKPSRQAIYERRKKAQIKPVPQPWDFMTSAQASELALQAYRVATWYLWQEMQEPGSEPLNHRQLRQLFANQLSDFFSDAVAGQLGAVADCHMDLAVGTWSVPDAKESLRKVRVWEGFVSEVPESWKPQYPLYLDEYGKKVTPASAANASGAVTTADEGNGNATHFR